MFRVKFLAYIMRLLIIIFILIVSLFAVSGFAFLWFVPNIIIGQTNGKSMNPTIRDGDRTVYNMFATPKSGDIIAFDCFSKYEESGELVPLVKRIIKINEQGCYWVEGDNKTNSKDSRDYGWLCPRDINLPQVAVFIIRF